MIGAAGMPDFELPPPKKLVRLQLLSSEGDVHTAIVTHLATARDPEAAAPEETEETPRQTSLKPMRLRIVYKGMDESRRGGHREGRARGCLLDLAGMRGTIGDPRTMGGYFAAEGDTRATWRSRVIGTAGSSGRVGRRRRGYTKALLSILLFTAVLNLLLQGLGFVGPETLRPSALGPAPSLAGAGLWEVVERELAKVDPGWGRGSRFRSPCSSRSRPSRSWAWPSTRRSGTYASGRAGSRRGPRGVLSRSSSHGPSRRAL